MLPWRQTIDHYTCHIYWFIINILSNSDSSSQSDGEGGGEAKVRLWIIETCSAGQSRQGWWRSQSDKTMIEEQRGRARGRHVLRQL
jgi:hypothetical protein